MPSSEALSHQTEPATGFLCQRVSRPIRCLAGSRLSPSAHQALLPPSHGWRLYCTLQVLVIVRLVALLILLRIDVIVRFVVTLDEIAPPTQVLPSGSAPPCSHPPARARHRAPRCPPRRRSRAALALSASPCLPPLAPHGSIGLYRICPSRCPASRTRRLPSSRRHSLERSLS